MFENVSTKNMINQFFKNSFKCRNVIFSISMSLLNKF